MIHRSCFNHVFCYIIFTIIHIVVTLCQEQRGGHKGGGAPKQKKNWWFFASSLGSFGTKFFDPWFSNSS
jgi:hypothetical protein